MERTIMALPDFLVIGAPKAGSTALHAALAQHPQLHLSSIKEPKFFLCDGTPPPRQGGPGDAHSYREWIWNRADYEALFDDAPSGTLRGESTPFYLSDFPAQTRIKALIPSVKLVAILRDPVDRAYSNWTHLWSDGLEPLGDFMQACADEERRVESGWARFWRYKGLGLYGAQLRHLYALFSRQQVHLLRYKELVDEPQVTLNRICAFLGVAEDVITEVPSENVSTHVSPTLLNGVLQTVMRGGAAIGQFFPPQVWRRVSTPLLWALKREERHRPELGAQDRERLVAFFADDIRLLEELTGDSYREWLTYRTGGTYSVRKSWAPSGRAAS
jgi:hypothetical protein